MTMVVIYLLCDLFLPVYICIFSKIKYDTGI